MSPPALLSSKTTSCQRFIKRFLNMSAFYVDMALYIYIYIDVRPKGLLFHFLLLPQVKCCLISCLIVQKSPFGFSQKQWREKWFYCQRSRRKEAFVLVYWNLCGFVRVWVYCYFWPVWWETRREASAETAVNISHSHHDKHLAKWQQSLFHKTCFNDTGVS